MEFPNNMPAVGTTILELYHGSGTKTIKLNHYSDKFIEQARHIAEQLDWI